MTATLSLPPPAPCRDLGDALFRVSPRQIGFEEGDGGRESFSFRADRGVGARIAAGAAVLLSGISVSREEPLRHLVKGPSGAAAETLRNEL